MNRVNNDDEIEQAEAIEKDAGGISAWLMWLTLLAVICLGLIAYYILNKN